MPINEDSPGRVKGVKDDEVLAEARKRYQAATAYADKNRQRYKEAMRFVGGQQWADELKRAREARGRPCLTMDRLTTHINQVVNDQRQSKPAIQVHPVDSNADVKTAEIYNGVIRNIEHMSNAPMVYETAAFCQVAGGQGAWRILTKYADEDAFEQDICLQRILDPTSVTFDPDAKEQDASDGKFAFIETSYTRDGFKAEYPDVDATNWASEADQEGWWSKDSVRVAEYYRVIHRQTTLYMMADGSVMDAEALQNSQTPEQPIDSRPAKKREVQWFKLGGGSVIDSRVWPGKWIPIVRVVGNELVVDGEIQYTGLTHRAMDAQRMYNYQTSVVVEMLSLQKTAPWIGAKGQFKGMESRWANANVNNPAFLEYEPVDLNGTILPAPQRQNAPSVPAGNVQAMQLAADDLQWITGQHSASFGAKSNETSGVAIRNRQQEGDTATYHYLDNIGRGILHTGRIFVDLIPKVMDTRRILRILGEDGSAEIVQHNPDLQAPMVEVPKDGGGIERIYNLSVGRYDVAVQVGPSFGTKRQESVEAMTQLLSANPGLTDVIGDIYLNNQDWPGAQDAGKRMKKRIEMLAPGLIEEEDGKADPNAQIAQMGQQMQMAEQAIMEREQQLQQAGELIKAAQAEIEQLQQQMNQASADVQTKTRSEEIKAQAEIYKADAEVRIAELQAFAADAQANKDAVAQDMANLQKQFADMVAALSQPQGDELGQIAANQQALAESVSQLAQAVQTKPAKEIEFVRRNGILVGARLQDETGTREVQFARGEDGKLIGAQVAPGA